MQAADIRSAVVKLLKSHKLRYINLWTEKEPQTGLAVTYLKFRTNKNHSPKAFFDDLNENGIQYKKLVKDPNAVEIICELWPKGEKSRATETRDKARKNHRAKENAENGQQSPSGNLGYLGIPSGKSTPNMVTSIVKDLVAKGLHKEAEELRKLGAEQNWEQFNRVVTDVIRDQKIHSLPAIRQLKEQLASSIVKALGPDAEMLQHISGADLEKKLNDVLFRSLDQVLDTRGICDSIIRRVAGTGKTRVGAAQTHRIRRNLRQVVGMAHYNEDRPVLRRLSGLVRKLEAGELDLASEEACALSKGPEAAYLFFLEESF